ncbi:MAG TPA: histidine kinase dimerization/phospho-acceptor domain-containing protein [Gaiellaceae bacterium]|nr:histidine kinase dimerization/phospho-acceptor domain-containing protein [Gaiellaceae bacterium]
MSAVAVDAQSQAALVGGLVHDLRNALLVIRGYSALIKPGLDPERLGDVEEIEMATDRATELTAELFDLARRYAAE